MNADVRRAAVAGVDTGRRVALLAGGGEAPYDRLVIAVGARPGGVLRGAIRFAGPADAGRLEAVLDRVEDGELRDIVFTRRAGTVWTLPLYELAVMAAVELRSRGARDARLTVVTPEREPLWLFGAAGRRRRPRPPRAARHRAAHRRRARAYEDGELEPPAATGWPRMP